MWIESDRISSIELSRLRRIMAAAPDGAVNMALGELGYEFPPLLSEKAVDLIQGNNPHYTPNAGLPNLRECIATYEDTDPENVCVCNGAQEALFITLMALVNRGDKVAVPDPDYPAYLPLIKMAEAEIVRLPFREDFKNIDWDLWNDTLADDVKFLILSHPSNPSGFMFSGDDFFQLARVLNKHGITLIIDEIYRRLYFNEAPVFDHAAFDRIIRVSGVSKSHLMSGWRIGWVIAPPKIISAIIKTKQYVSTCAAWLSQILAAYALQHPEIEQDVRQHMATSRSLTLQYLKNTDLLSDTFKEIHIPDATPYLLLRTDYPDYATKLVQKGVITVPGRAFGEVAQNWIRINCAIPDQELIRGLEILSS